MSRLTKLACALLVAACGGEETAPDTTGKIHITLSLAGDDFPLRFFVEVDGSSFLLDGNKQTVVARVGAGSHQVFLRLTQVNCRVEGDNPRSTTVVAGQTTPVSFLATCTETRGSVHVTTVTAGVDLDLNGFAVSVKGFAFTGAPFTQNARLAINGEVFLSGVPAGNQTVTLEAIAPNCDVVGSNPRPVAIEVSKTLEVAFSVTCAPAGLLAYIGISSGTRDLYVLNVNGSGVRRLTNDAFAESDPAWSPDGTRIAFSSERDGNREIYVMDLASSVTRRLTNDSSADYHPAWSPDGRRIAFVSERGLGGDSEIFAMDADGGNVVRLTSNPARDGDPAWSPDGRRIAFTSARDAVPNGAVRNVYIMNADGSGATRLTQLEGGQHPAWSPDGNSIAYAGTLCPSYPYGCYPAIFIRSGTMQTVPNFGAGERPSWSPDGLKIAFEGLDCDFYLTQCVAAAVRIGRVDGTGVTDVVAGINPAWRP